MSHGSDILNKRPVYDNGGHDVTAPRHKRAAQNNNPPVSNTPHAPVGKKTFPGPDVMKGPRILWYWVLCTALSVLVGLALAELFDYLNQVM